MNGILTRHGLKQAERHGVAHGLDSGRIRVIMVKENIFTSEQS